MFALKFVGVFALGCAAGFAAGWYLAKDQLEAAYQNDLDEMKEEFNKNKRLTNDEERSPNKEVLLKYRGLIEAAVEEVDEEEAVFHSSEDVVIITSDEYAYDDTFDKVSLIFYAGDNVLADGNDFIFDENEYIPDVVKNNMSHLLSHAVLFIRDGIGAVDYEIILDRKAHSRPMTPQEKRRRTIDRNNAIKEKKNRGRNEKENGADI
jgi:hypothetical protein